MGTYSRRYAILGQNGSLYSASSIIISQPSAGASMDSSIFEIRKYLIVKRYDHLSFFPLLQSSGWGFNSVGPELIRICKVNSIRFGFDLSSSDYSSVLPFDSSCVSIIFPLI